MSDKPITSIKNNQSEFKIFTLVISLLLHIIVIVAPLSMTQQPVTLRNLGVVGGTKTTQLFLKRESEKRGEDLNLSTLKNIGRPETQTQNSTSSSDSVLSKLSLPSPQNMGVGPTLKKSSSVLTQKIKGKDVTVPDGVRFSEKSKHAFAGSMFDVGIILPEGIKEDELNRFEEMFYSFRKRVAEQYINQILRISTLVENRYPRTTFPWTNRTQILRAKLTFDSQGNLQRISYLQKTDAKILQEFYQEVMNSMSKIPNPPNAIVNSEDNFELIFGLNIID